MDLFADAKELLRIRLDQLGVELDGTEDLESLLHLALNLEFKSVFPRPRSVHRSYEFDSKLAALLPHLQATAEEIMGKTTRGEDLAGHLSRASTNATNADPLLIDWALQHLHISTHKKNPGDLFFASTGPLMFVFFTDHSAYFIDIYGHGSGFPETWSRIELLEIIYANWPEILEPYRSRCSVGSSDPITDPAILADLRKHGINHPVTIDGKLFFPPGGGVTCGGVTATRRGAVNDPTCVGNSLAIGEAADFTMMRLNDVEHTFASFSDEQNEKIAEKAGVFIEAVDFELRASAVGDWFIYVKGTELALFQMTTPFEV